MIIKLIYTKFIFTALIGAIIGYITNWLAIKMLFRPHEEKKIFGIKIPFTPGLIPKEQKRIAKSVSDAIGDHLLTSDTMIEALKNNGIDKRLKKWVVDKTKEFCRKTTTLKFEIKNLLGNKFEGFVSKFKTQTSQFFINFIKKDEFKNKLEDLLIESIKEELLKNPKSIVDSKYYNNIKEGLLKKFNIFKETDKFKAEILNIINKRIDLLENTEKKLDDIIPSSLTSNIKFYIYNNNEKISSKLKVLLKEDKVKNKVRDIISDMIGNNLNPMVAMFINADMIFNKIQTSLDEYLDKEENQKDIALFINDIVDKIMDIKIKNITSGFSENGKNNTVEKVSDIIIENIINDSNLEKIISKLENNISSKETLKDVFLELNIDSDEVIRYLIKDKIKYLTENSDIEKDITKYVDKFVENILNLNINELLKSREDKISDVLSMISDNIFNKFISTKAIDVIEAFEVKKIVENKINSFEVSFTEKLILDIASKELNAITWLGALLGFIMGLISSIITIL